MFTADHSRCMVRHSVFIPIIHSSDCAKSKRTDGAVLIFTLAPTTQILGANEAEFAPHSPLPPQCSAASARWAEAVFGRGGRSLELWPRRSGSGAAYRAVAQFGLRSRI